MKCGPTHSYLPEYLQLLWSKVIKSEWLVSHFEAEYHSSIYAIHGISKTCPIN